MKRSNCSSNHCEYYLTPINSYLNRKNTVCIGLVTKDFFKKKQLSVSTLTIACTCASGCMRALRAIHVRVRSRTCSNVRVCDR